jgi:broad specificity phosphatase PhoE
MRFPQSPTVAEVTRLWFIRHGEVETPYIGTFLGSTDVGLSDLGRHQAQAIAGFMESMELDAVLSSPLSRAANTAAPTCTSRGSKLETVDWAKEMHFGTWEGKHWPEIELADPEFAGSWQANPWDTACPDGDVPNEFAERVQAGLTETMQEFAGRSVALFAHAGTNRAIISAVTGRPYCESFAFSQDYGSVNAGGWDVESGHGQIAMLNVVPGPPSEAHGDGGRRVM